MGNTVIAAAAALAMGLGANQADGGPKTVAQVLAEAPENAWIDPSPDNVVYLETETGRIVLRLAPDMAPGHTAQFRRLVRNGFYDGLHFYRVIEGFVAQGGDESGEKDRGDVGALASEFEQALPASAAFTSLGMADGYAPEAGFIASMPAGRDPDTGTAWLAHCAGAVAFARGTERDSASTEFYIALQPQRYLDRNLTVVGQVIDGMASAQAMPRSMRGNGGVIADRDRWTPIVRARLESDVPQAERLELEILDTSHPVFAEYVAARAARASEFFVYRPNHVDLCQLAIPVRDALADGAQ